MSSIDQDNYFELFGLRPTFDIDIPTLEDNYIKLQQHIHPDNFAALDDLQRSLAAAQTARINQGYVVLMDPIKRARYLLLLCAGVDALGEQTINNNAFLMEQMEWREALEGAQTEQEAKSMTDTIQARLAECRAQFAQIWDTLAKSPAKTQQQTQADPPTQEQADSHSHAETLAKTREQTQAGLPTPTQKQADELTVLVQRMQYLDKLMKELGERDLAADN